MAWELGGSQVPHSQELSHFWAATVTGAGVTLPVSMERPLPWRRESRAPLTAWLLGLHLKAGNLAPDKAKHLKVAPRHGSRLTLAPPV